MHSRRVSRGRIPARKLAIPLAVAFALMLPMGCSGDKPIEPGPATTTGSEPAGTSTPAPKPTSSSKPGQVKNIKDLTRSKM